MDKSWIIQNIEKKQYFNETAEEAFPKTVEKLLMEASLLYHVPFSYLIPDYSMIKEESLEFFSIDYNWVLAYMDGICSIGRNASIDYTHDTKLLKAVYEKALKGNGQIRNALLKAQGEEAQTADNTESCSSGFWLRSGLVEDFRGIEVQAYGDAAGKERLVPLRIEKMGKQLLLGIFKGKIHRVEFIQPPEGLHYGFIRSQGNTYKTLRNAESGVLEDKTAPITMRGDECRTVDWEKTAGDMKAVLNRKVTSADLGLQMIQNAHTGVFIMGET